MKKEDVIDIIKTSKWTLLFFGLWLLLFVFGVYFLHHDITVDNKIKGYASVVTKQAERNMQESRDLKRELQHNFYEKSEVLEKKLSYQYYYLFVRFLKHTHGFLGGKVKYNVPE